MSHLECLSLIYIATQAHTDNSTWIGSAGALAGEIGINPRTVRDIEARQFSFEILKLKRLIPRFNPPERSQEKMKKNENSPERYPARNDSV